MAARAGIEGEREHLPNGHLLQSSESFINFERTLQRLRIHKLLGCHCYVTPTSWSFDMTFQRAPNNGGVTFIVCIQRTDEDQIYLDVDVDISVTAYPDNRIQIPPISFRDRGLPSGVISRRIFEGVIPNNVLGQLYYRSLLFEISLRIHGCHNDDDLNRLRTSRKSGNQESKALFSKM